MGEEILSSAVVVSVREFDPNKDREGVEAVEKICEVGPTGKLSLFTDLHGDPICRVRNSPTFLMLVCNIKLYCIYLSILKLDNQIIFNILLLYSR